MPDKEKGSTAPEDRCVCGHHYLAHGPACLLGCPCEKFVAAQGSEEDD